MLLKTFMLCFSVTHTHTTFDNNDKKKIYFLIINDDLEERRTIYTYYNNKTEIRIFTDCPMSNNIYYRPVENCYEPHCITV